MDNYKNQYLHPNWQKKRLKILERDNFTCKACGAKEKTLHIHHWYYKPKAKVWEYPDSTFETLCEKCHCDVDHYPNQIMYIASLLYYLKEKLHKDVYSQIFIDSIYHSGEGFNINGEMFWSCDYDIDSMDIVESVIFNKIRPPDISRYMVSCCSIGNVLSLSEYLDEDKKISDFLESQKNENDK